MPGLSLHILYEPFHGRIINRDKHVNALFTDASATEVIDQISIFRDCIIDFSFYWGSLFSLPFGLGEEFRKLTLSVSNRKVGKSNFGNRADNFQVRLPEEAELLPHILGAIIGVHSTRYRYRRDALEDVGHYRIGQQLVEFVSD